jgi:hypothetical protein
VLDTQIPQHCKNVGAQVAVNDRDKLPSSVSKTISNVCCRVGMLMKDVPNCHIPMRRFILDSQIGLGISISSL